MAAAFAAPPAQAGNPGEGFLYVINAGKAPAGFKIDQAETAALPAFSHLTRAVSAGPHGLAAVIGARVASDYQELDLADAGRDARGRAYWCVMLSDSAKGAPRMTRIAPDACAALVRAEDETAPPIATPIAHAAGGGLWTPQGH